MLKIQHFFHQVTWSIFFEVSGRLFSVFFGCLPCLEVGGVLPFFVVGVDAEIDLYALAFGCGFNEAANGGGGKSLASDQGCDVRLAKDEAEIDFVFTGIADAEFGEFWVFNELEGDVLDEVADLSGDLFHFGEFTRVDEGCNGNLRWVLGIFPDLLEVFTEEFTASSWCLLRKFTTHCEFLAVFYMKSKKFVAFGGIVIALCLIAAVWCFRGAYDRSYALQGEVVVMNTTSDVKRIRLEFPSGKVLKFELDGGESSQVHLEDVGDNRGVFVTIDDGPREEVGYLLRWSQMLIFGIGDRGVSFFEASIDGREG